MSKRIISDRKLTKIADAIRTRTETTDPIKMKDMADIIEEDIDTSYEKFRGCLWNGDTEKLTRLTDKDMEGITNIGYHCLHSCQYLEEIDIPDTAVGYLGNGALMNTRLKQMTHMGKPTTIGQHSFAYNYSLQNVVIPETVTRIMNEAFVNCTSLTEVDCRATTPPELSGNVFKGCTKLKFIFVPADCVEAYKTDLNWMQYADIIYGSKFPFVVDRTITCLTADDLYGTKTILQGSLRDSEVLSYLEFPNTRTTIATMMCQDDKALEQIIIPDSVETIGSNNTGDAFSGCDKLKTVVIGTGVHTMYETSFYKTSGVKMTIICKPTEPPAIGNNCFPTVESGLVEAIYVPRHSVEAYKAANRWSDYADIIKPITYKLYYNTAGRPGTKIDDTMYKYVTRQLTEVTSDMLTGATLIGNRAFASLINIKYICLPESIARIRAYAFYNCTGLTTIECRRTTPPTLVSTAFFYCTNLKYIYVPEESVDAYKSAEGWSAYADIIYGTKLGHIINRNVTVLTADDFAGATVIPLRVCFHNEALTSVEFSNTITDITSEGFSGCSKLTSVIIPDSVINIGSAATEAEQVVNPGWCFDGCTALTQVIIGTGIKQIFSLSFRDCRSLTTFICKAAPATAADVPIIDSNIFTNCYNLTHIYVPSESVDLYKADSAWSVYADKIEAMPDEYAKINTEGRPGEAWDTRGNEYMRKVLTYINADEFLDMTELPYAVFHSQKKLQRIYMPDTITSMHSSGQCFIFCSSLSDIRLSNNLSNIGSYCFLVDKALTNITLPATMNTIKDHAFSDCIALTTVECRAVTPPTLEDSVFSNCPALKYIYVPADSVDAYKSAEGWSTYANIIYGTKFGHAVERCLTSLTADDFAGVTGVRYGCARSNKLTNLEFSNTITGIGSYSFANNIYLKKVIIPDSVIELGTYPGETEPNAGYCFAYCTALEKIVIGTGMQTIGNNMFDNNSALTTIVCKATTPPTIVLSSLSGPANLAHIYVPSDSVAAYKAADNWSEYASIIEAITDDVDEDTVGRSGAVWDSKIQAYFNRTLTALYPSDFTGTTIGFASFALFTNLKTAIMPDTITNVSEETFLRSGIEEVHWPTGRSVVDANTFNSCTSLKNIVFPSIVTAFYTNALANCTSLTTVELRSTTPPTFGTNMFKYCTALKYIYVPAESVDLYKNASGWSDYADIIYGSKIQLLTSKYATSLTADDFAGATTVMCGLNWSNAALTYLEFSNTITGILYGAFQETSITNLVIPDSVVDIGLASVSETGEVANPGSCFNGCKKLTLVIIGTGIKLIYNASFYNCTALKTVVCKAAPTTAADVPVIDSNIFNGCVALEHIYVPSASVDLYKADSAWSVYADKISAIPDEYAKIDTVGRAGTAWDTKGNNYLTRNLTSVTEDYFSSSEIRLRYCLFLRQTKIEYISLPDTITSTSQDLQFANCASLKSIKLPSSLDNIPANCFLYCEALPSIVLPATITAINTNAFRGCSALTTVECRATTPPTLGTDAFKGCTALKYIYVPADSVAAYKAASGWSDYADKIYGSKIKQLTSYNITSLTADDFAGATVITNGRFRNNTLLKSVELSNTITHINYLAFRETRIKNIIIPDSVQIIGSSTVPTNPGLVFGDCTLLEYVVIGTGLELIYAEAFRNCTALKTFVCKTEAATASDVPIITTDIFNNCPALENIYVPANSVDLYKADPTWSYYADKISAIPDEWNAIDTAGRTGTAWDTRGNGFLCRTLTSITADDFGSTMTDLEYAFCMKFLNLQSIVIPDTILTVNSSGMLFYVCESLTSVTLPSNLDKIALSMFFNCLSLPNITIPSSVTSIKNNAFDSCIVLTTVKVLATTPPELDSTAFRNCPALEHIYVPSASVDTYKTATNWSTYADIIEAIPSGGDD